MKHLALRYESEERGLKSVWILKWERERELAEEYQVLSPSPFEVRYFIKMQYYSLLQNEF